MQPQWVKHSIWIAKVYHTGINAEKRKPTEKLSKKKKTTQMKNERM